MSRQAVLSALKLTLSKGGGIKAHGAHSYVRQVPQIGSGEAIPLEPPSLASPRQGERGGGEGVASIPLVDLSESQAAVFNLSRCASFRIAMLR